MKTITIVISLLSLLALGACSTEKPLGRDFGNSVRHNMAVQTINPEPSIVSPLYDGEHAAQAIKKYNEGTIEEPEAVTTTGGS
jgi:type IV pilus biogenesis protein CpaD/CtpE